MSITKQWKIAGASAVVAGLGLGAAIGLSPGGADESDPASRIALRDAKAAATAEAPDAISGDDRADLVSPDGESFDSPLQSADDSPDGQDSADTPGEGPNSMASQASQASPEPAPAPKPAPAPVASVSVDSPDRPAPAPAPAPRPAPAPAPAPKPAPAPRPPASADSPASAASVASPASAQSVDSPD